MVSSDPKYAEFLALLKRRGMNITRLAKAVNLGRSALNQVLLGLRPGKPTWEKLYHALTKAEWDIIHPYATARYARLLAEGKVKASGFVAKGGVKDGAKDPSEGRAAEAMP